MFKRFISWLRAHGTPKEESELDQKKRVIRERINQFGLTWDDIEKAFFWETPIISFAIYTLFVGIFWKLISYELQRIGLTILLLSGLLIFQEIRKIVKNYLEEKSFIKINEKMKCLGFGLEDTIDTLAQTWLGLEAHYLYLMKLKEEKDIMLCFYLALYIGAFGILFGYLPLAELCFVLGTFVYFYPVCSYLGIIEKMYERFEKMVRPITIQWANNKTKRTRNRKFHGIHSDVNSMREYSFDSGDEEFVPRDTSEPMKREKNINFLDTTDDSADEFDLRGQIHMKERRHSSDFDEDSFLPGGGSGGSHPCEEFPSMSQFDSMMEPLDDDFHAGLDFQNVTARSVNEFGVPDRYLQDEKKESDTQNANETIRADDTDEDIDDLPIEETDGSTRYAKIASLDSPQHGKRVSTSEGNGFEFVDKEELHDITDEEINEQNTGQSSKGIVSNMLGY